ncbi:MAG: putative chromosome condensation protein [Polyangiaceae bacterium]|nr:putative chromosome condensation protein [Polyangiaceae bacterium]
MPTTKMREVEKILSSQRQLEGAGFIVRRPLPAPGLPALDPFLLIDEMGPVEYRPGEAVGAPDHPHRGFETVTYVLEGEVVHEDSAGHRGTIKPGGVQWMTAGGGIIHSETPSAGVMKEGGRAHGFQIWVNLPARLKMTRPRYQELEADQLPTASTSDGLAHVKIIAGEALGTRAAIDTLTPIVYQDWSLRPGADVEVALDPAQRALVYVFGGSARVGNDGKSVKDGQLAVLGGGDVVRLRAADEDARLLLLAGVPLNEPVARYQVG